MDLTHKKSPDISGLFLLNANKFTHNIDIPIALLYNLSVC